MREILFRGKTSDGEWVEGSLKIDHVEHAERPIRREDFYTIADTTFSFDESDMIRCMSGIGKPVDPATVGQYIGMRDTNGKRIFEGDILSIAFDYDNADGTIRTEYDNAEVYWSDEYHGWYVRFAEDAKDLSMLEIEIREYEETDMYVIGNIYDNPEYLDGATIEEENK